MHYQGGKYRFIKHITPIIQAEIDKHQARHFISPFCGACNIESAIVHTDKTCNDKNEYIIRMWREVWQKECLQETNKNPKNTGRRRTERLFYKSNREGQDGHIKT